MLDRIFLFIFSIYTVIKVLYFGHIPSSVIRIFVSLPSLHFVNIKYNSTNYGKSPLAGN